MFVSNVGTIEVSLNDNLSTSKNIMYKLKDYIIKNDDTVSLFINECK
jgi:hypothetical protein